MKIKSLELKEFSRFELSNIKEFSVNITSPIQIVIGDNGSGKSSLLGELTPSPAGKPLYNKNGYKNIKLEHGEDNYELISDFSSKNHIHSFIKNGSNLNISGTSGIQQDLCREHLNYTPLIDDLIRFKYKICEMGTTERKIFFLSINPIDLSIITEKHKLICSKLRDIKANTSMTNKRKQELITKRLEDVKLEELNTNKNILTTELENLTKEHISIEDTKNKLEVDLQELNYNGENLDIKDVKNLKNRFFRLLSKYIKPENVDTEINNLSTTISVIKTDIENIENNLSSTIEEVTLYTKHLEDAKQSSQTNILEEELKNKQLELTQLDSNTPNITTIDESKYDSFVEKVYPEFTNNIIEINNLNIEILSLENINKLQNELNTLLNYNKEYGLSKSILTTNLSDIDNKLLSVIKSDVATLDICNECDYKKVHYKEELSYSETKNKLTKDIEELNNKIEVNEKLIVNLSNQIEEQRTIYNYIKNIRNILQDTIFSIDLDSLVISLQKNKNKLHQEIRNSVNYSINNHKREKLRKDVKELTTKLEIIKNNNLPSIDFLKEILTTKENIISTLQKNIRLLDKELKEKNISISEHKLYKNYLDEITLINSKLELVYYYTYISKSIEFYNNLLVEIRTKKEEVLQSLTSVNNILKEQYSLEVRIKEEMDVTLEKLSIAKEKYELIEFGISPVRGFPHKHLVKHINSVINNANVLINHVWSYPLTLQKLEEDKELTYNISVLINETVIKSDISKLSKGQQLIINLAFMISCMISMNITNYPIYLDECDDGLDPHHKQKLLELQRYLVDNKYVSQMFIINHEAALFDGFSDQETLALRSSNIIQQDKLNTHVKIN